MHAVLVAVDPASLRALILYNARGPVYNIPRKGAVMNENLRGKNLSIAIGSDHAGYPLKEQLADLLRAEGYNLQDFGAFSPEPVDYPDVAREVAEAVAAGQYDKGILICGTGIGMTITANKVKGIRAAACADPYSAKMARAHNNANILGMGGRVVGQGLALDTAIAFLDTEFEFGSRHERRVDKTNAMDER